SLAFDVPAERRPETATLTVALRPSLALTLVDALPYLVQYPYGCTEQTVSRFAPAAVVARTLREAGGLTLKEVLAKRAALPKAHEQGAGREAAGDFDLDDVIRAGLARLRSLQHADGGFGWWRDDDSSPYMTAYALQGLLIARDADVAVDDGLISGATRFLKDALPRERDLETAAFVACVAAKAGAADRDVLRKIYDDRDKLGLYGRALLASGLKAAGMDVEAGKVVAAFADFAEEDASNGTAHWGTNDGRWWRWWNSRIETNAAILHAYLDVAPEDRRVPSLVKWIALNRRGNRWTNTRDTAHCVFALVRYARSSGELDPDYELNVSVNGEPRPPVRVTRANLFDVPDLSLAGAAVPGGTTTVTLRLRGRGRCYAAGEASFFTREPDIAASGRELLVERAYLRVTPTRRAETRDGVETVVADDAFEPLSPGAALNAGDVVEVRLIVEAKNDYEHLLFEDMKPAGFEPLEVRSGGRYANGICSNVEFRDRKTALFATWLEQGRHVIAYRLRAELPGTLRAAPARGEAMYAPDVGGTSSSFRFTVQDARER
ncbi:MAG TPA: hypothetical protein VEI02_17230, partial [Planctomycetota bacterium]|nr:hypothetical protein [Planctomycetota bacterium]